MDVGKAPCPPECTMEEISDFIKAEQEYETDSDKDSTPCLSFISPEFAMEEIPDFIKTEQEFESDSDKDRTPPLSSSFPAFAMEEIPDFIKTEQEFESDSDPKGEDESDGEGEDEPDSDYEYLFYSKNYRCVDFSFTDQKWTNRTRSRLTLILERKSESGGDNSDRELEAVHEVEVEPHPESDSPYLFRNYRCPETRANWVVDAILPENDSEEDEDGSDYMPLETDGEESSGIYASFFNQVSIH